MMKNGDIRIRAARVADTEQFISLVTELASYEKLKPPGREEMRRLIRDAFGKRRRFELLMAFSGRVAVAYAVYFMTYSTFLARPTLYLEDIFVKQEFRRAGVGGRMFSHLASIAQRRKCGRMEWSVLKWNSMALSFYGKLGATELKDWSLYRLAGENIKKAADRAT